MGLVYTSMMIARSMPTSKLWLEYRDAFENFSSKVRQLQSLTGQTVVGRSEVEASLLAVEQARLAYNQKRDLWARELLRRSARDLPGARHHTAEWEQVRVKAIAELLWHLTGRPKGSAEDDWYRAESIVRRASSAMVH